MNISVHIALVILVTIVTHSNAQDACKGSPTDVIFLIDASMPHDADFHTALGFVEGVAAKFSISVYDTKVALVKLGNNYRKIFSLASYTHRNDVLQAIRATTRNGHGTHSYTDLGDALSYTKSTLISTYYGRRPSAKLVVVVITTKTDSIPASVSQNALSLRNHGATIYAIGVGPLIQGSTLTAVATDRHHNFHIVGFGDLAAIQDTIVNSICPAPSVSASVGGVVTKDDCPTGVPRDFHLQVYNGMCYRFVTYRKRTFSVAKGSCEINGGSLVIIKDAATNLFIYNELAFTYKVRASVWIGLLRNFFFRLQWVDGSDVTYYNIHGGVPRLDRRCVAMDATSAGSGGWRQGYHCDASSSDWSTADSLSYVCQYQPTTRSPTAATTAMLQTDTTTISSVNTTMITRPQTSTSGSSIMYTVAPWPTSPTGPTSLPPPWCPPFTCDQGCAGVGYTLDASGCAWPTWTT